ncbi:hypothetical protein GOP47_0025623 [Adiantum capillus-veneris]|uniref:Uncharacterized protein n=1 Tax=Adiantum capillus-veneris TaxID=13818 RepID=A0A9D4Z347_ADICA|nr:hypothetical protein GOP47_0025623 [Adiantum capillus-veneris]
MTMHARAHSTEKENVESGSARTRFGLSLSKAEASIAEHKSSAVLFGFTNEKRFQERSNKPLKEREVNVLDEAGGGLGASSGSVTTDYGDGLAAAFLEGSQSHHLKGTPLDYPPEEIGSLKPGCRQILVEQPQMVLVQERLQEASCGAHHDIESYKAPFFSTESMRAPLLREYQDRSEDEIPCDLLRPDDPFLFTQLQNPCEKLRPCFESKVVEIQCVERSPCAEESDYSMPSHSQHIPNTDHVVVLFSVQKCLEDNAARANRYKLLKLSSFCSLYSHKVFGWVTRMVREQNITYCLQRIQQIFSPSAARGFTRLDSQKLPKVSTKMCSPSSKKGLGKDKELRVVLLKINEVLASMKTSSSENMQDRNRSETTVSSHG